MLGGTLILAGGAMVMSFPKIVGNSILLEKEQWHTFYSSCILTTR